MGEDAKARRDGSTRASSPLVDQIRRGEWKGEPKLMEVNHSPEPKAFQFSFNSAWWWSLRLRKDKASFSKEGGEVKRRTELTTQKDRLSTTKATSALSFWHIYLPRVHAHALGLAWLATCQKLPKAKQKHVLPCQNIPSRRRTPLLYKLLLPATAGGRFWKTRQT